MAKLVINADRKLSHINKELQGHFSEHLGRCIYEGLYVGENSEIPNVNGMRTDVVEALKQIRIPVLRWPGGCFADEYHWKDGIGPNIEIRIHVASAAPVFIAHAEIIYRPRLFVSVFGSQVCHRGYTLKGHVFYPFGHFLYSSASHIAVDVCFAA